MQRSRLCLQGRHSKLFGIIMTTALLVACSVHNSGVGLVPSGAAENDQVLPAVTCSLNAKGFSDPMPSHMTILGLAGAFGALRYKVMKGKPPGPWTVHTGVDLSAPDGTPVLAIGPGKVIRIQNSEQSKSVDYGWYVVLSHDAPTDNVESLYAHLSKVNVKVGDQVGHDAKHPIALSGHTGNAEPGAPHLHLELSAGGPLLSPDNKNGSIIHANVVNPCGTGDTGSATISVVGNVQVTSATLDDTPLPSTAPNVLSIKKWSIGVKGSNQVKLVAHSLDIETKATCSGTYSVAVKPGTDGGVVFQGNSQSQALLQKDLTNGQALATEVIVYQNPGINEKYLKPPSPTPAPTCSPRSVPHYVLITDPDPQDRVSFSREIDRIDFYVAEPKGTSQSMFKNLTFKFIGPAGKFKPGDDRINYLDYGLVNGLPENWGGSSILDFWLFGDGSQGQYAQVNTYKAQSNLGVYCTQYASIAVIRSKQYGSKDSYAGDIEYKCPSSKP
jgi:murein DD-endopeptidase MepM/ murein hydrolase activator NlpD